MWKAFRVMFMIIIVIIIIIFIIKVGLIPTDIYEIAHPEDAATNAARLERLWQVIFVIISLIIITVVIMDIVVIIITSIIIIVIS